MIEFTVLGKQRIEFIVLRRGQVQRGQCNFACCTASAHPRADSTIPFNAARLSLSAHALCIGLTDFAICFFESFTALRSIASGVVAPFLPTSSIRCIHPLCRLSRSWFSVLPTLPLSMARRCRGDWFISVHINPTTHSAMAESTPI